MTRYRIVTTIDFGMASDDARGSHGSKMCRRWRIVVALLLHDFLRCLLSVSKVFELFQSLAALSKGLQMSRHGGWKVEGWNSIVASQVFWYGSSNFQFPISRVYIPEP